MNDDGSCPKCGDVVSEQVPANAAAADDEKAPWHFKLMVVALVVYLGWRFISIFI